MQRTLLAGFLEIEFVKDTTWAEGSAFYSLAIRETCITCCTVWVATVARPCLIAAIFSAQYASLPAAYDGSSKPQKSAFIESFNGCACEELLGEEMFHSLHGACRKLALWRYDYSNIRPHSSLENQTPAEARRTLEQFESSASGALAQTDDEEYENQSRRLSLQMREPRGAGHYF